MQSQKMLFCLGAMLMASVSLVNAKEKEILAKENANVGLELSIYNKDLAFVKDVRRIQLNNGKNAIAFEGVSSEMIPETAMLLGKGVRVLEQNYDYNLLNKQNLFKEAVGQEVLTAVYNQEKGKTEYDKALILNDNYQNPILKFSHGIETDFPGRIVYKNIPQDLRVKPTLAALVENDVPMKKNIELAYLTRGLSWKADYIAQLKKDDKLDLNGWITLNNESGSDYKNAEVQLVAGQVAQVQQKMPIMMRMGATKSLEGVQNSFVADAAMPQAENLADYYLYRLPIKTTLKNKQTKQVSLMSRENVSFVKNYEIYSPLYFGINSRNSSFEKNNPDVVLKIKNVKESNLGEALPEGIIRFYENDTKNNLQFVGESRLPQLTYGGEAKLTIGKAFDITIEGKTTDKQKISADVTDSNAEIVIKNSRPEEIQVNVVQNFSHDWKILEENHQHSEKNAESVIWKISVPADGEEVLKFKVRVSKDF